MTTPDSGPPRGRLVVHTIESRALANNPHGDPARRAIHVYLPAGHDPDRPYPALLALAGFGGTGATFFNTDPFGESLDRRLDRLIASGACPPVIVAAPDCFNRLGGSQYINSPAVGRYEDHVVDEVVPFVSARHAVGAWGVFGKSSGGYGAMVLGMRHPHLFRAVADQSGDSNFELCYLSGFGDALTAYRRAGGPRAWLDRFWADDNRRRRSHMKPLDVLAMAAHYSPDPASPHMGIAFPFDLETGVFRPDVWERWRAWDPVQMVPRHADALRSLALIYIDCGERDEFHLQWGARALAAAIEDAGAPVVHETFADGHMSISYRYDASIPRLARALSRI